jgi:peptidoglycan/xylan/chitin deacetylase (PgdA/CDA1 family)
MGAGVLGQKPRSRSAVGPRYSTSRTKYVWLTFDDGPHPTNTEKILKTLSTYGIKATFFVVGENVSRWKRIVKLVHEEGHRIGNHSYSHPHLTKLSAQTIRDEIRRTDHLIAPYGTNDKIFRPPYGDYNATVGRIVRELGYRLVFWNVDTLDWSSNYQPTDWIRHGIDQIQARDSCIVLNHDIQSTTSDNLEDFLDRIMRIGGVSFMAPCTL